MIKVIYITVVLLSTLTTFGQDRDQYMNAIEIIDEWVLNEKSKATLYPVTVIYIKDLDTTILVPNYDTIVRFIDVISSLKFIESKTKIKSGLGFGSFFAGGFMYSPDAVKPWDVEYSSYTGIDTVSWGSDYSWIKSVFESKLTVQYSIWESPNFLNPLRLDSYDVDQVYSIRKVEWLKWIEANNK